MRKIDGHLGKLEQSLTVRQLDPNSPDLEERIADDPLMKAELAKQAEDVKWLSLHRELPQALLREFRQAARSSGGLSKALLIQVEEDDP